MKIIQSRQTNDMVTRVKQSFFTASSSLYQSLSYMTRGDKIGLRSVQLGSSHSVRHKREPPLYHIQVFRTLPRCHSHLKTLFKKPIIGTSSSRYEATFGMLFAPSLLCFAGRTPLRHCCSLESFSL